MECECTIWERLQFNHQISLPAHLAKITWCFLCTIINNYDGYGYAVDASIDAVAPTLSEGFANINNCCKSNSHCRNHSRCFTGIWMMYQYFTCDFAYCMRHDNIIINTDQSQSIVTFSDSYLHGQFNCNFVIQVLTGVDG